MTLQDATVSGSPMSLMMYDNYAYRSTILYSPHIDRPIAKSATATRNAPPNRRLGWAEPADDENASRHDIAGSQRDW